MKEHFTWCLPLWVFKFKENNDNYNNTGLTIFKTQSIPPLVSQMFTLEWAWLFFFARRETQLIIFLGILENKSHNIPFPVHTLFIFFPLMHLQNWKILRQARTLFSVWGSSHWKFRWWVWWSLITENLQITQVPSFSFLVEHICQCKIYSFCYILWYSESKNHFIFCL